MTNEPIAGAAAMAESSGVEPTRFQTTHSPIEAPFSLLASRGRNPGLAQAWQRFNSPPQNLVERHNDELELPEVKLQRQKGARHFPGIAIARPRSHLRIRRRCAIQAQQH